LRLHVKLTDTDQYEIRFVASDMKHVHGQTDGNTRPPHNALILFTSCEESVRKYDHSTPLKPLKKKKVCFLEESFQLLRIFTLILGKSAKLHENIFIDIT
jgi:hypothetical protein